MPAKASAPLLRGAERLVFGLGLGDDVVGDVARAGGVVVELHGELAATGGRQTFEMLLIGCRLGVIISSNVALKW